MRYGISDYANGRVPPISKERAEFIERVSREAMQAFDRLDTIATCSNNGASTTRSKDMERKMTTEEVKDLAEVQAEPLCWVFEDELPASLTTEVYNALFAHSKVDGVRMFPVFGPQPAPQAQPADAPTDPIRQLISKHAALLAENETAYFELCYHRTTGWMAWLTDKPLCMPTVINPGRKVIAQGQGDTAEEACADAMAAAQEGKVAK